MKEVALRIEENWKETREKILRKIENTSSTIGLKGTKLVKTTEDKIREKTQKNMEKAFHMEEGKTKEQQREEMGNREENRQANTVGEKTRCC